jgi:hypothetical protein
MNVPGDSRQERLNNVIRLIGQEVRILDALLEEFTNILKSSNKIRILPGLKITELLSEFVSGEYAVLE